VGIRTSLKKKILNVLTKKQSLKMMNKWEELYGKFDDGDYEEYAVDDLPSESRIYHGELIKWALDLKPHNVLFAGENKTTSSYLQNLIHARNVYSTGLADVNYKWNFEKDPPEMALEFDLVVTQAILEHLLNPYKHVQDLSTLVKKNGYLLIHTVMPGFHYHRYPIDSVRFFPDWFEGMAKRLDLMICKKRISDTHIFYLYQKK
jgi:hypothetical protein